MKSDKSVMKEKSGFKIKSIKHLNMNDLNEPLGVIERLNIKELDSSRVSKADLNNEPPPRGIRVDSLYEEGEGADSLLNSPREAGSGNIKFQDNSAEYLVKPSPIKRSRNPDTSYSTAFIKSKLSPRSQIIKDKIFNTKSGNDSKYNIV